MAVISRGEITISNVNDGLSSFTHQAYAWSADGTDRFTKTYPHENLLKGSKDFSGVWRNATYWTVMEETYKGLSVVGRKTAWNGIGKNIEGSKGDKFVYSVYLRYSGENNTDRVARFYTSGNSIVSDNNNVVVNGITNEWKRFTFTFTLTTNVTLGDSDPYVLFPRVELARGVNDEYLLQCGLKVAKITASENIIDEIYTPHSSENYADAYPAYIGSYIDSNKDGSDLPKDYTWRPATGKDGLGIASVSSKWQLTSTLTAPTQTWDNTVWLTSQPTTTETSRWLWQIDRTTYTNGTTSDQITLKAVQGQATSYWVSPSVNVVKRSATGTITPTSVTFNSYSKIGTANSELYAGRFIISTSTDGTTYTTKYTSSANQSTFAYAVPTDAKFIKARLYLAGGTTALLDEQTIPILESAEDLITSEKNLLLKSNTAYSSTAYGTWWKMTEFMEEGVDYTLKVKGTIGAGKSYMSAFLDGGTINLGSLKDNGDGTHSVTFKGKKGSRTDYNALYIYFIPGSVTVTNTVEWIKLVKGNTMFSQWSPAPEEAQLYTAWSNDPNGKDMVRVYPNENLLDNPYTTKGISWDTTASDAPADNYQIGNNSGYSYLLRMGMGSLNQILKTDDVVTVSFDVKMTVGTRLQVYDSNDSQTYTIGSKTFTNIGTEKTRLSFSSKVVANGKGGKLWTLEFYNGNNGDKFTIENVKIEYGEIATVYTPSPKNDPVKAEMAYIGYSPKDSNNPTDYKWTENPKVAQISANVANNSIAEMSKDSVLSAVEKNSIAKEWATIQSDYPLVKAQGTKYNISLTTLNSAYSALSAYITPLLALMTINSTIVPATFQATFKNYYDAKLVVLNAINDSLGKSIDDAIKVSKTYTDAQIKISKDAIDLSVIKVTNTVTQVSEDLSNLSIGGRNYFSVKAWKARPILTSNGVQYIEIGLEANTQYTLSTNIPKQTAGGYDLFFFKGTEAISSSVNGVAQNEPRTIITNADGIVKVGMRNYNDALNAGTSWIMLTKGNKALDWTPALEDAQLYTAWSNDPNGKDMVRVYPNENLLVRTGEFTEKIIGSGGGIDPYAGNNTSTVPIPVTAGETLYFSQSQAPTATACFRWRWLDADMKYISRAANASNQNFTGTVPAGASYLQVSYSSTWDSKIERNGYSFIVPSPQDDPVKAEMAYIGYSAKDSNDPKDYVWSENPKAKGTFKRWSNDPNGLVDMTDTYPNENLLLGTSNEVQSASGTGWFDGTRATNATQTPPQLEFSTNYTYSAYITAPSDAEALIYVRLSRPSAPNGSWEDKASNIIPAGKSGLAKVTFSIPTDTTTISFRVLRFASAQTSTKTIKWSREKLELGSNVTTWTSNQQEDKLLSIPQYVGIGSKDTMNPADFVWTSNSEYERVLSETMVQEVKLQLTPESIYAMVGQAPEYISWQELIDSKPNINDLDNVYDQLEGLSSADETILASMAELEMANNGVLTSITQAIEGMDGTLSTITDYMFFGTNGLTIGKSNSTLKVNISNTELAFYDNSTKVAWVDSQRLNIREALIEKKIKVGNHIIEKFDDKEEITIFKYDGI